MRFRWLLSTTLVILLAASLAAIAGAASAIAADFAWSGSGSSTAWSEGSNWLGGTAPTAGSSLGTVSFPAAGTHRSSTNDLSGLSLNQLRVEAGGGYTLSGQALTLGSGGLSVVTSEAPLATFKLANPVLLGGDQTWTIAGTGSAFGSDAEISGQLSGTNSALTLNDSSYANQHLTIGELFGATSVDDELGNVSINGVEKTEADGTSFKTPVELQAKLNASDGHSVNVDHLQLTSETAVGPLNATDSWVGLDGTAGPVTLTRSVLGGNLSTPSVSFDSGSEFIDGLSHEGSTPGTDYGQIKASGTVALDGAALVLEDQSPEATECPPPVVGRIDTLISAGTITGQFADVPNGGTAVAFCVVFGSGGITSERAYAYRINYNTTTSPQTVTATSLAGVPEVVTPPPSTPVTPQGPAVGGSAASPSTPGTSAGAGPSTASVSRAQIAASLNRQLAPSGNAAKIGALLKRGGLAMPFTALTAGTLSVQWYQVPAGAKLAKKARPVLVASGMRTFSAAGAGTVSIKLTGAGKRLLKHAKRVKLAARAVFARSSATAVIATTNLTLRR